LRNGGNPQTSVSSRQKRTPNTSIVRKVPAATATATRFSPRRIKTWRYAVVEDISAYQAVFPNATPLAMARVSLAAICCEVKIHI
jgi:hypothetical protein